LLDEGLHEKMKRGIHMAQGTLEKEILSLTAQLSDLLTGHNYREAYTIAGTLNAKLKGDVVISLPIDQIQGIKSQLRRYYNQNDQMNALAQKMYGTGKRLAELAG